jgi:signal transduction histidine kinase
MSDLHFLQKKLAREQAARVEAERLLEQKSLDLYHSQQQLVFSEKLAAIGQLAAGVAHEINNPVGFVASNLQSLQEYTDDLAEFIALQGKLIDSFQAGRDTAGVLKELQALEKTIDTDFLLQDARQLLQSCSEGTTRVKRIVSDLSEYSHVRSDEWGEADVAELLEKSISIAYNEIKYKAELCREIENVPLVYCDAGKLEQMFLNLLVNAAHAIAEKGVITVRIRTEMQSLIIEIEDTGCGIACEDIEKIFDPFYTSKEIGEGTGLGLHVVQGVVDAHSGTIKVHSVVGKGTRFVIRIPLNAQRNIGRTA